MPCCTKTTIMDSMWLANHSYVQLRSSVYPCREIGCQMGIQICNYFVQAAHTLLQELNVGTVTNALTKYISICILVITTKSFVVQMYFIVATLSDLFNSLFLHYGMQTTSIICPKTLLTEIKKCLHFPFLPNLFFVIIYYFGGWVA